MRPQYDNKLMSSFLLWMDHKILSEGSGFVNKSTYFYSISSPYSGIYAYASPYSQFVADRSVAGANVPTGIHLDGSFLPTGTSGFVGINYERGQVYFNTNIVGNNRISGYFAVKEVPVYTTNKNEAEMLFETKVAIRPKTLISPTGLNENQLTIPAVFIKNNGSINKPFQFGGTKNTINNVLGMAFTDSDFLLTSLTAIFRDTCESYFPVLEENEFPFNIYGHPKNGTYNYDTLTTGKPIADQAYVSYVNVSKLRNKEVYTEAQKVNPGSYFAVMDFTVEKTREV